MEGNIHKNEQMKWSGVTSSLIGRPQELQCVARRPESTTFAKGDLAGRAQCGQESNGCIGWLPQEGSQRARPVGRVGDDGEPGGSLNAGSRGRLRE